MNLVNRAVNIITRPRTEWAVIDAEPTTVSGLFTGYAVILALIPLVGTLLSAALGLGQFRHYDISFFLITGLVGYVLGLGILYLIGIIANALAPSFDGVKSDVSAMKLVVYSATPIWIAGILNFIPGLSFIIQLAAFGYAAYLMYLGSMAVMKVPEGKAIGYTAVVIIIWIILSVIIIGAVIGAIVASMVMGGGAMPGNYYR